MILTKRDWRGAEKLPEPGYVLAVNHLSWTDPVLFGHWMVDHGITPRYLAKDPLFEVPLLGGLLRRTHQIPVYRGTSEAIVSLKDAITAVGSGGVVTFYPEGTMTRDAAAWPMTGRTGAVRVAHASGRPLVPVAQWGPQQIMFPYSKRVRLFPRVTIHVRVGDPLDLTELGDHPTEEQIHRATDQLMDAITELLVDIRGERPTTPRIDVRKLDPPSTRYRPEEES